MLDVATTDATATSGDYTDADGTITFTANDPALTTTVALTADTALEDLEYLTFSIDVTDATTAMTATVSATAKMAKIFIIDRSSK